MSHCAHALVGGTFFGASLVAIALIALLMRGERNLGVECAEWLKEGRIVRRWWMVIAVLGLAFALWGGQP